MTSNNILSIFVDESGRFQFPDSTSRFYIVALILHNQNSDITPLIKKLDSDWKTMGYEGFCFHAGPLIRKEKGYSFMPREERGAIFSRMLKFARQADFKFHCLIVDKSYVTSARQIIERLQQQLSDWLTTCPKDLFEVNTVKVYYDCGQSPLTKLLQDTFRAKLGPRIEFAQGVRPDQYKLFQLADLVCTIQLIKQKLSNGQPMTQNEFRFFGGPRKFIRNVFRQFSSKQI